MRWTKLAGLAVSLVALTVVINALAFKSATVTNAATMTVSTTQTAALAISAAGSPGTGFTANYGSNYLQLSFTDSMQPNSKYKYINVFQITNNTTAPVTLGYAGTSLPTGVTLTATNASGGANVAGIVLAASGSIAVDVQIDLATNATLGTPNFGLDITATQ